ncbi:hypothetical protein DWG18_00170 [Lysobacter sp. TY2-98]|uniref:DUF7577 domain-containing protein n=1 Tax=Lysobacter sp. TY2-98 TaxID=2290922 RepID=UPI000E207C3F|nr:zinc ribbon domain-containing protein [Lysobacter sp. TY2-98]AXK70857.1 hypothetical protein DWG18_00170 [Lysobacter sp. TY2-98]
MLAWTCPRCGTQNDADYALCASCGARPDGSINPAMAETAPGGRVLDCLRCGRPMTFRGSQRFHEGSQAAPFLLGGLGELLVNRQTFDVFACPGCGKVEFFVDPADH